MGDPQACKYYCDKANMGYMLNAWYGLDMDGNRLAADDTEYDENGRVDAERLRIKNAKELAEKKKKEKAEKKAEKKKKKLEKKQKAEEAKRKAAEEEAAAAAAEGGDADGGSGTEKEEL